MGRLGAAALIALVLALVVIGAGFVSEVREGASRQGAHVKHFTIDSAYLQREMRETAVIPAGTDGRGRPLLVFLHGDARVDLDGEMFAALHALGRRAPVLVFAGSGERSYITDELIPLTEARFGIDGARVAVAGISTGGSDAYELAARSGRHVCAAGGHSPALRRSSGVVGLARSHPRKFARQPLWLDAGRRDPFDRGDRAFVRALRAGHVAIDVRRWPGGNRASYRRAHWDAYLRFYAGALARCG